MHTYWTLMLSSIDAVKTGHPLTSTLDRIAGSVPTHRGYPLKNY